MKKSLLIVVIIILLIAIYILSQEYSPGVSSSVKVESLSSASGTIGTTLTITGSGFTPKENSIKFDPGIGRPGYINYVDSSDGTSLEITFPATGLSACQEPPVTACIEIALGLEVGKTYRVSVINGKGESDSSPFTLTPVSPNVFEGDLRNLPLATPPQPIVPFSGNSKDIKVALLKSSYALGDTITIQITNSSSGILTYYYGPGCGTFFERKVKGEWRTQEINFSRLSGAPCQLREIGPGEQIQQIERIEAQLTPVGLYRIVFEYEKGKVYSNEFNITASK